MVKIVGMIRSFFQNVLSYWRCFSRAPAPKNPQVAFCAVFRDEAPYLEEWIQFHLGQGISHFFLYDDASSDDFRSVLGPWKAKGVVTLFRSKGRTQEEVYNDCLKRAKGRFNWLGYLDIDEFLFTPRGKTGEGISGVLADYSDFAAVFVFWKLFGSSNRRLQGERGVIESFTKSLHSPETAGEARAQIQQWQSMRTNSGLFLTGNPVQGKSLVNLTKVKKMSIHFPDSYAGNVVDELKRPIEAENEITRIYTAEYPPTMKVLRINHYWSRGREALEQKTHKPGVAAIYRTQPEKKSSYKTNLEWDTRLNGSRNLDILLYWRPISAPRIFLIGFNKTATRAFSEFFEANGMPSIHWDNNNLAQRMVQNLAEGRKVLDGYDTQYKFYSDFISVSEKEKIEANSFFREMDSDYPGSYFILNNRRTADWITSRERHNSGNFLRKNLLAMGTTDTDLVRDQWKSEKENHEREVRQYFLGRTNFIEIDIDSKNIPELVSNFLSMDFDATLWKVVGRTL